VVSCQKGAGGEGEEEEEEKEEEEEEEEEEGKEEEETNHGFRVSLPKSSTTKGNSSVANWKKLRSNGACSKPY
jgi:hypothetical protein